MWDNVLDGKPLVLDITEFSYNTACDMLRKPICWKPAESIQPFSENTSLWHMDRHCAIACTSLMHCVVKIKHKECHSTLVNNLDIRKIVIQKGENYMFRQISIENGLQEVRWQRGWSMSHEVTATSISWRDVLTISTRWHAACQLWNNKLAGLHQSSYSKISYWHKYLAVSLESFTNGKVS